MPAVRKLAVGGGIGSSVIDPRRLHLAALVLALGAASACGPAATHYIGGGPMGPEYRGDRPRFQMQRRPAELTVYDRDTRRRYRVDLAAQQCYEEYALLDHCPPEGDIAYCPRTRDEVQESNTRARASHSIGGCEQNGCPDVETRAECADVRNLGTQVRDAMQW